MYFYYTYYRGFSQAIFENFTNFFVSDSLICLSWQCFIPQFIFIFPSFPVIYSKRQAGFPLRLNTAKNIFYDFFFTCSKNQPLFAAFSYFLICLFSLSQIVFPFLSYFSIFHPSLIKGHFFLVSTRFQKKFLPIFINFSAEFSFCAST